MASTKIIDIKSKFYIRKNSGGYSPCIQGNNPPFKDSVLYNCVGFVVGYFNEKIAKEKTCKWLGNWQPSWFLTGAKGQGLKTGNTAKVGAVAVWKNHVAIVKSVSPLRYYESGWNYPKSWAYVIECGAQSWHKDFLGYIYPPETEPPKDEKITYKASIDAKKYNKIEIDIN